MAQKTQAGTRQGGPQQARGALVEAVAHRKQGHGGDTADASGQAIEAIKPIDGIGDAHQPKNRGHKADPGGEGDNRPGTQKGGGQINAANAHPLAPDRHGYGHLAHQSRQRRQGKEVIRQANYKEAERAGQGRPDQLILIGGQCREAPPGPGQGQRQAEAGHDAHSPQAHDRALVVLAGVRGIDHAPVKTRPAHQGHDHRSEQGGQQRRQQGCRIGTLGKIHGKRRAAIRPGRR